MAPWEEFDTTFSFKDDYTYDAKVIDQILSNRQALDNLLFIDRLLKVLGIDAGDTQSPLSFQL
jgi:protein ELYS